MTDRKRMAPRVLEYKLTAALRTLQEVAQALESVLESRGGEGWHSYDKTDAATHPPKDGGYLVTLKGAYRSFKRRGQAVRIGQRVRGRLEPLQRSGVAEHPEALRCRGD